MRSVQNLPIRQSWQVQLSSWLAIRAGPWATGILQTHQAHRWLLGRVMTALFPAPPPLTALRPRRRLIHTLRKCLRTQKRPCRVESKPREQGCEPRINSGEGGTDSAAVGPCILLVWSAPSHPVTVTLGCDAQESVTLWRSSGQQRTEQG